MLYLKVQFSSAAAQNCSGREAYAIAARMALRTVNERSLLMWLLA